MEQLLGKTETTTPMLGNDKEVLPILQRQEKEFKSKIPSILSTGMPSPSKDFNNYILTGEKKLKEKAQASLSLLKHAATDANDFAKSFIAGGIPKLLRDEEAPKTYRAALKEFNQNVEKGPFGKEALSTPEGMQNAALSFGVGGMAKAVKPILKEAGDVASTWLRHADDFNKNTDSTRGGTWFTDKTGSTLVKDNPHAIGGSKTFEENFKPKKPLIIENAELSDGSYSIINNGYDKALPTNIRDIADDLYTSVFHNFDVTDKEIDLKIMDSLFEAGIPEKQARTVLNESANNKFDAAMDLIISKGLKEKGYDSLILNSRGEGTHMMKLASGLEEFNKIHNKPLFK